MKTDEKTAAALQRFASNSKLFSLLDEWGLKRLAVHARIQEFPSGATIVQQGEVGDSFYLISQGELRVLVEEAAEKEVARLGPGMFFGEVAVLTRQPRSATVEACTDCELIRFERDSVLSIVRDYPKIKEVLGSVGLSRSEDNLERAMKNDDDGGLAALLEGDTEDIVLPPDLDESE